MAEPITNACRFPLGREYAFRSGTPAYAGLPALFLRLLLCLFIGPGVVFGVIAGLAGVTGSTELVEAMFRFWPILLLASVGVAAYAVRRTLGQYLQVRAFLRATRGREIVADDTGFRVCRAFASLGGWSGFPGTKGSALDGIANPYVRVDWSEIGAWNLVENRGDEGARARAHRICLKNGKREVLIDRSAFGPEDGVFLELARERSPVPIVDWVEPAV